MNKAKDNPPQWSLYVRQISKMLAVVISKFYVEGATLWRKKAVQKRIYWQ
jgi:hypothetical protein